MPIQVSVVHGDFTATKGASGSLQRGHVNISYYLSPESESPVCVIKYAGAAFYSSDWPLATAQLTGESSRMDSKMFKCLDSCRQLR